MFLTMEDCNKLSNRETYSLKHTGKMLGIPSLSTSRIDNEYCQRRKEINGYICEKCYVNKYEKLYKNLSGMLLHNSEILKNEIIPLEELPFVNAAFFRFESFGDVDCITQEINYFNLCKRNPHTTFAQWTKNPWIIDATIEAGNKKPGNLIIIVSSVELNNQLDIKTLSHNVDKVFTVYTKDYIFENAININCGSKKCLECQLCYHKDNRVTYVNEILK